MMLNHINRIFKVLVDVAVQGGLEQIDTGKFKETKKDLNHLS